MKNADRRRSARAAWLCCVFLLACGGGGGGDVAANGGMSGTGISQGSITAFGSIFVGGVEWDLGSAMIELDGNSGAESDLRVGMVVRVEGDFDAGNLSGTATRVIFDDSIEGPIAGAPVETVPGVEKQFTVLGQTVFVRTDTTVFANGATFAGLAQDDVVEVSGFVDAAGAIRALRIERDGAFPGNSDVELRGLVTNLVKAPNNTGMFDLGPILVRYDAATVFDDVTRAALMNGDLVEVEGTLRANGTEIDATTVELESDDLGSGDLERVELEGIVTNCPPNDFCIGGVPVDTSGASFEPVGFVPAPGDRVEVEGALEAGVLVADEVESEDEDLENVRIEAAVSSVDTATNTLVILGVTITADPDTILEDDSSVGDESFTFAEIQAGNFLEIRARDDGSTVRALEIQRDDATPGADDVRLEGPVTALNPTTPPALSVLDQVVPLDAGTLYFDEFDQARTEEEFFRNPGDVALGDIVSVQDENAADLAVLGEADEVAIED